MREIGKSKIVQLVSSGVSAAPAYTLANAGAGASETGRAPAGREERRVKDEGARGGKATVRPRGRRGEVECTRFSKEKLSAVKNHAPRHGRSAASALHTLALNLSTYDARLSSIDDL